MIAIIRMATTVRLASTRSGGRLPHPLLSLCLSPFLHTPSPTSLRRPAEWTPRLSEPSCITLGPMANYTGDTRPSRLAGRAFHRVLRQKQTKFQVVVVWLEEMMVQSQVGSQHQLERLEQIAEDGDAIFRGYKY